jgi:hypothetical protein
VVESQRTLVQPRIRTEDTLVLGRYRLLEEVGAGGFGTVWRAHDETIDRFVALKRIWLGPGRDIDRAVREARAAGRLTHPAIVTLHDSKAANDAFWLISEFVEGHTLAELIDRDELTDEEILEIGAALAEALGHAHGHGVIHRDVKPQNVLVPNPMDNGAAAAKLTDFGGASLIGEGRLTQLGGVLGTPDYMAPEQANGQKVGEEVDLYSLALILYEALCGFNPMRNGARSGTVRRTGSEIESLARERGDLPRALTDAIDTALSLVPADRGTVDGLHLVLAETLDHGLRRPRFGRVRDEPVRAPLEDERLAPTRRCTAPGVRALQPRAPEPPPATSGAPTTPDERPEPARARVALPRELWIAAALAVVAWQALSGHTGIALLAAAALLPLLLLPGDLYSGRVGAGWLACALAPLLGLIGLAGAFPAVAGQASRWRWRLALGALGYWWLNLAEPLLGRRLWLGAPSHTPLRAAFEASTGTAASHVLAPMLSLGVLLGALLWACGALALPWIVRGSNFAVDLVAVVIWSALLAAAAPALDAGLAGQPTYPSPHGIVLGAVVGALFALAARALRGPV